MTTSCCAGYNEFIKKHLPEIEPFVSETQTPLYYTAEIAKKENPDAVTVFVSPCVAKRREGMDNQNVDFVMNYEELGALLVGRKIDVVNCEETPFDRDSSKQGRNFGVSGGVSEAVKKASNDDESIKPFYINGLTKESIKELKKMVKNKKCECGNIVEVMCCEGGCIGGNATINSPKTAVKQLNEFSGKSKDINSI